MITVVARFRIRPGQEQRAEEMMSHMAVEVQSKEQGCLMYLSNRSQQDASEVVMLEAYENASALEAHSKSEHMGEFRKVFGEVADMSTFKVEVLQQKGGFGRLMV